MRTAKVFVDTRNAKAWLTKYMDKVSALGLFTDKTRLNHVLVNEYIQGQGIMPHLDGPLFYPTVTTISCGSHTVLNFYTPTDYTSSKNVEVDGHCGDNVDDTNNKQLYSLFLERRSLLILQDEMYKKYLHGISENNSDVVTENISNLQQIRGNFTVGQQVIRDTRISLTIRHVPKTTKLKLSFLK